MSIKDEVLLNENKQITSYIFTNIDEIMNERKGDVWNAYRKAWNATSNISKVSSIPLYILLELNSFCNLKCKMCKHALDSDVEKKSMDIRLFNKIIEECIQLGVPSINIGTATECTLHPNFKDICYKLGTSNIIDKFFLTNGSTLSDEMIDYIFIGGFERVEISVDAATEKTYSKIRCGGNFTRLEQNIERLLEKKKNYGLKLPIIRLSFCVQKDNIEEIDAFYEKWKDKVDIIEYQKVSKRYVGNLESATPKIKCCTQPFNRMTIDYDGNIYPCCSILFQNEYCIGNINNMTLLEAWESNRMRRIREGMGNNEKLLEHCKHCLLSIYG